MRLVPCMQGAGDTAASLLIECRGRTPEVLQVWTHSATMPIISTDSPSFAAPACFLTIPNRSRLLAQDKNVMNAAEALKL